MLQDRFYASIHPRIEYKTIDHLSKKMIFVLRLFNPDEIALENSFSQSRSSIEYRVARQLFMDANDQLCYLYLNDFMLSDESIKVVNRYEYQFIDHTMTQSITEDLNRVLLEWIIAHYGSCENLRHQCATRLIEYYTDGLSYYIDNYRND